MGFFENFPYTNFHEINLDQIIKIMRQMQDEWQQVKNDWDSMQDFINNYFDNLDVSEEVLAALQTMAGDGELNTIIDPVIVAETASWLAEHITPTSPAVDNTLSIAGAAADAKATGDAVADLKEDLKGINITVYDVKDMLIESESINRLPQITDYTTGGYLSGGVVVSDPSYSYTDFIEIENGIEYKIGLVPVYGSASTPWMACPVALGFYDNNQNFIRDIVRNTTEYSSANFTSPYNAKYIRINMATGGGLPVSIINARAMMVKGNTLPSTYSGYFSTTWKLDTTANNKINYIIEADGNGVTLITKYNSNYDIAINLKKKGGNNLFDFNSIGIIPNTEKSISTTTSGIQYLIPTSGDWFSPFIMRAVNNGDGDNPTSYNFTGGNHQYNNQGSGSTPTARTTSLKLLADNMEVAPGSSGSCSKFNLIWSNRVQGYNTAKEDGSGREILQEDHKLVFDGTKFEAFINLIPLEDVVVLTWYGIQWFTTPYPYVRYIGGANRGEYTVASSGSTCGDSNCCYAVGYGTDHEIRVNVDETYDLGDHKYYSETDAIFTVTYGKGYFNIIKNTTLAENNMYSLHGHYQFAPHN